MHPTPANVKEDCCIDISDGSNVREFDQEPEELKEDGMALEEGDVIAMGVMPAPVEWRTYPADLVSVSEEGKLATHTAIDWSLTHTGEELTEGRHYWEVEVVEQAAGTYVGVCRPDADPRADHGGREDTTAWLMGTANGSLCGNGEYNSDAAGGFNQGDRMGILLDLDDGSLRFFKNGVEHGPGYPAGSVTGPVARAAQMYFAGHVARLLPNAAWPAGHAP